MGIASLVLSIVSLVLGFVPFVWLIAIIPALVGLILGIISLAKKKQKGQSIAGIVISVITIVLLIFTFVNLFKTIGDLGKSFTDSFSSSEEDILDNSFLNEEDNSEKLKQNIAIESLGITANGDFAFKITNNNDEPVYLDSVSVVFKDANGNFALKDDSDVSYFSIPANTEVINFLWGLGEDYSQYPNYEFEIEMASSYSKENMLCDNFEIKSNNTGEQIAVEVVNNNEEATENTEVVVAYYQGDKIVGCETGYGKGAATGESTYINVDYPVDSDYDEVTFDKYEVYLLRADKTF